MSKQARTKAAQLSKPRQDWPIVVYLWIMGLGILGYLVIGELLLMNRPHPLHWAAGLGGAVLGVPIGWLWYRWRGDV